MRACHSASVVKFSSLPSDMEHNFQKDLPMTVEACAGGDGVFNCVPPKANPPVNEWVWFKGIQNRSRLQSDNGKITVNNSQLIVHNTTFEDSSGFYSCSVHNGNFSRDSMTSHLTVNDHPRKLVYPIGCIMAYVCECYTFEYLFQVANV